MRRFKSGNDEECPQNGIIMDLGDWGYPRPIESKEMQNSNWFWYGPDCIFWLEPVIGDDDTAIFHICVDPKTQRNHLVASRRLFMGVDVIAECLGFTSIIANDCTDDGIVADYLHRLGWKPREMPTIEGEWFEHRLDGEDVDGKTAAPEDQESLTRRGHGGTAIGD